MREFATNQFRTKMKECKLIIKDEVTEKNPFISPELSYPYMVEQEGKLHLVYTYGRTRIEYIVIEL